MTGEGLAGGIAGGLAVGLMMQENAKSTARRKCHLGEDQVLIKSKRKANSLLRDIAGMYENWFGEENKLMRKKNKFNIGGFFGFFGGMLFLWFSVYIISMMIGGYDYEFFTNWTIVIFSTILISFLGGFLTGGDEEVDYIEIEDLGKERLIQLKVYNEDGYRNLDNKDILKIQKFAKSTNKNEVKE